MSKLLFIAIVITAAFMLAWLMAELVIYKMTRNAIKKGTYRKTYKIMKS